MAWPMIALALLKALSLSGAAAVTGLVAGA
jgi:hypothetical protein